MSPHEKDEEQRLYNEFVSVNARLRAARTDQTPIASQINELELRLARAHAAYESFETTAFAQHSELKSLRGQLPPFSMEDASRAVRSDTAVIHPLLRL